MLCAGSLAFAETTGSSEAAAEGTAAHHVASEALKSGNDTKGYAGRRVVTNDAFETYFTAEGLSVPEGSRVFEVDDEMVQGVQAYLDRVRKEAGGGEVMVERKVAFGHLIGLTKEETGTLDAGLLVTAVDDGVLELQVHDFKYGTGVKVFARENPQLLMYAAALYDEIGFMLGVARLRLFIHQPRLDHLDEWVCTPRELQDFLLQAAKAVSLSLLPDPPRVPGDTQCKFCPGKAQCPEYRSLVLSTIYDGAPATPEEFDDRPVPVAKFIQPTTNEWLSVAMNKVDLIEQWCRAVRAEVETRLVHGTPIKGWKLVQGRKGPRKWTDEADATKMLKSMRLKHDQMFEYKLISPTEAERLAKAAALGKRQWDKLQSVITRSEGSASVAPEADPRAALTVAPTTDEFADETPAITNETPTSAEESSLEDLL